MPGYERYERLAKEIPEAVKLGSLRVTWRDGGKAFEYERDGKKFRYDIALRQASEVPKATNEAVAPSPPATTDSERPERGRQYTSATSPDGQWKATYRDRNLWLSRTNADAVAITTDGSEKTRIKFGTANWVYGEELYQTTAMWWSTNSQRLAFYRFDERAVLDYYLTLDHTQFQNRLDVEPYMKVGAPNPVVDLLIYDVSNGHTVTVDVRSGQPFSNDVPGHYVYGVSWTADGSELLFHRTNRRQNIMEFCAADPVTGRVRVVVREEWLPSWTENLPPLRWLQDGRRFIWTSHRTGWRNLYLFDLSGALLSTLTTHSFDVADVKFVDEPAGLVYYTAHSGDNPMKLQLHRVTLDGRDERCLTDRAFHHTVDVAPDGRHFVDVAQTHDTPPVTWLRDAEGRFVAELARSDLTKAKKLGLLPVELLRFKAADGGTELYGMLHFPSNFRPSRKYPLLVHVYAGPETVGARETFTLPDTLTEFGFLVASFDSRSASGRGKRFLDAIYQKLGIVEIDDQAAGVQSLWPRRYVDRERVGIYGTSYGGTAAAACLLRYPQVFQAACASSAVTDFRNYDTIYTERYLGLLPGDAAAYDAMSLLKYAPALQGRLLIFFGTADNNVHPANSLQLIAALQKAGKSFEVQVGPDQGHTSVNRDRMMEFFIENLVINKPPKYQPPTEVRDKSEAGTTGRR
ncbi:MAG: DPP IV N-terminal domain-containing protein [Verrucomicrobia bacterium]|nr:DPP IV N-terminal domain-containing protein [Verrucomicrobiota bacterium]